MRPDWKAIDEKMRQYASPKVSSEEKANIRSYVWLVLLDETTEDDMFIKFIRTDLKKDQKESKNREAFINDYNLRDKFSKMYLDLIDETMKKYDPAKNDSYSNYFRNLVVKRGNNLFTQTLVKEHMSERLDDDSDDGGQSKIEKIGSPSGVNNIYILIDTSEWCFAFANIILQARLRDADGIRSAERLFYRSMFYSDTISALVRGMPDLVRMMSKNNRLLFKAMDVSFLDYIFIKQCRRISELAECATKRMCDMSEVHDPSTGCCKIPTPQRVFAGFVDSVGKKADVTTISKRQKSYLKEIEGLKELLGADVG